MRLGILATALLVATACEEGRTIPEGGTGRRVDTGVVAQKTDGSTTTPAMDPDAGKPLVPDPDSGRPVYYDARPANDDASVNDDASAPVFFDASPPVFADAAAPIFPDAAAPLGAGEIWIELDYSSAQSPRSPTFRYSNTPGWGAAQWAASNASGPEAWDRFNNMQVVNDPIGTSLEIGGGSELQLMIGLEELIGYDHAEVIIEGRSRATSSSVQFDTYNPWNSCGDSGASLGQQWTVQSLRLDLAQCFVIGQGVQAVRVDPTNGTIALVRLRLTLFGAIY